MELEQAKEILKALAVGINPQTGTLLPLDSFYHHSDTVLAFQIILLTLDNQLSINNSKEKLQQNDDDSPWSDKEDKFLQYWFKNGKTIEELANRHKRTEISIRFRLQKFGLIRKSKIITYNTNSILKPEKSYVSKEIILDCKTDKNNSCDVKQSDISNDKNKSDVDDKNQSELEKANSLANLYAYNRSNILESNPNSEDWSDILDDLDGCNWMEIMNVGYYDSYDNNENSEYDDNDYL